MTARQSYHHGDLRTALMDAVEQLIEERGVDGFSLREAARRAGVSPSGPAHHFGDMRGLMTAVATRAFADLANELEQAIASGNRKQRIAAQGTAYVRFAQRWPNRFALMWRNALLNVEDEAFASEGGRAYAALARCIGGEAAASSTPHDLSNAPAIAAWSIAHGFASLMNDGVFGASDDEKEAVVTHLWPAVLHCLRV
jgi:AcrR family transcriptional regulator